MQKPLKKAKTGSKALSYLLEDIKRDIDQITGQQGFPDSKETYLVYLFCAIRVRKNQLAISVNLNYNFSVLVGILARELQKIGYDFVFVPGFWVLDSKLVFNDEHLTTEAKSVLSSIATERTFVSRAFGEN